MSYAAFICLETMGASGSQEESPGQRPKGLKNKAHANGNSNSNSHNTTTTSNHQNKHSNANGDTQGRGAPRTKPNSPSSNNNNNSNNKGSNSGAGENDLHPDQFDLTGSSTYDYTQLQQLHDRTLNDRYFGLENVWPKPNQINPINLLLTD